MCVKFQFYSSAQLFAFSLDTPVEIVIGQDSFYWVVEEQNESMYLQHGCSRLC